MTKVKRNFKDSLFRLVFHGKEELLSLYNAVNGTWYLLVARPGTLNRMENK